MFAVSMPNAATSSAFVLTATKCLATASSPSAAVSQRRASVALVIVSTVVNVFELTTTSVVAGSRSARLPVMSAPSTLLTNRHDRPGWPNASVAR